MLLCWYTWWIDAKLLLQASRIFAAICQSNLQFDFPMVLPRGHIYFALLWLFSMFIGINQKDKGNFRYLLSSNSKDRSCAFDVFNKIDFFWIYSRRFGARKMSNSGSISHISITDRWFSCTFSLETLLAQVLEDLIFTSVSMLWQELFTGVSHSKCYITWL